MSPKTRSDDPMAPLDAGHSPDPSPPDPRPEDVFTLASDPSLRTQKSDATLRPAPEPRFLRRNHPPPLSIGIQRVTGAIQDPLRMVFVRPTPPPTLPTPLLLGCPGREISGAKSDGREWAYDWDSPPVLLFPDDLSKTKFHEHPLARHIELERGWEKHQLAMYGLILPAKVDNGTPTYTWESDEEEEEDLKKAVILATPPKTPQFSKPAPLVPAIPVERPRTPSNILTKVKTFANFVANNDMEKDNPELPSLKELIDQFGLPPKTPAESGPRSCLRPTRSSGSLRPKTPIRSVPSATKLRNKRSATGISKSQISDPVAPEEMRRIGQDFSEAAARTGRAQTRTASESERISAYAASLRSPSNLVSQSISSNLPLYLLQPQHPTVYFGNNEPPPKFRLARPRLAPMEYARLYLLAKAKAEKQGEKCTVQRPRLTWCWSEDYKEIFLLPSLPECVTRNFFSEEEETDAVWEKKKRTIAATSDMDIETTKRRSFVPLPLNLAPSSPLLPAHFRNHSHSSVISSTHQRNISLNDFNLDQPRAVLADQNLLQSTKALITDPSALIPYDGTDFFVANHTSSEGEFTSSFTPQFLLSSSSGGNRTRNPTQKQAPSLASDQVLSATAPTSVSTGIVAKPQTGLEQLTFNLDGLENIPPDFSFAQPLSAASSQKTVTPDLFILHQTEDVPAVSPDQVSFDDARSEVTAVYRPESALSSHTVIRSCSTAPPTTTNVDEDNVSPNSVDLEDSNLPPAPVSPLSSSYPSPKRETYSPLQDTRTHDTWDDAQTQQPRDETIVQTIADDGGDSADTSSIYSQDSVLTAVHRPVAAHRHTNLDFMPQTQSVDEGEDDLTPRQQREPSSFAEIQPQARTLRHSPILRPVSYIPNTQAAQTHTAREVLPDPRKYRHSQASALTTGSQYTRRMPVQDARLSRIYGPHMEADIRRMRTQERQQNSSTPTIDADARRYKEMLTQIKNQSSRRSNTHETASVASVASSATSQHDRYSTISDAPSVTSASTIESYRSQALSLSSLASSDRSTTSKSRRSRIETTQDAIPNPSHPRDPRFAALEPVMESPAASPGLKTSATSPAVSSAGRSRNFTLPNRRASAQQATDSELSAIKARRRRAVIDMTQIPASQAYPEPLRFNPMKCPAPGGPTNSSGTTSVPSASRLITDIGNELNREMENVLPPRSATAVVLQVNPQNNGNIETPTRRPPRHVRPIESMRFEAPTMPAPSKPLPSIPPQTPRSAAPGPVATSSSVVDVDFGPGPTVTHAPTPEPPPRRTSSVPQSFIPTAISVTTAPDPPSPSHGSEFVTRADFSVKMDRTMRPTTSAGFSSYRPIDQAPQRQLRRPESASNLQRPSTPTPPPPPPLPPQPHTSARTGFLGKVASMAELKHRKRSGSGGSGRSGDETSVGMRTFLGEDAPGKPGTSRPGTSGGGGLTPPSKGNSKKKFFGALFRRKKDGEK